jgi:hypothetical protein
MVTTQDFKLGGVPPTWIHPCNRYGGLEQMVRVGISFYVDKSICCFQAQELSMYFGNQ